MVRQRYDDLSEFRAGGDPGNRAREWKILWPLAAGLTTSCGAMFSRRTKPADALSSRINPHECNRIPYYLASLVMLH